MKDGLEMYIDSEVIPDFLGGPCTVSKRWRYCFATPPIVFLSIVISEIDRFVLFYVFFLNIRPCFVCDKFYGLTGKKLSVFIFKFTKISQQAYRHMRNLLERISTHVVILCHVNV